MVCLHSPSSISLVMCYSDVPKEKWRQLGKNIKTRIYLKKDII